MDDFELSSVKVPQEWLERMGKIESRNYGAVLITSPDRGTMSTSIEELLRGGIPVGDTFSFIYDSNPTDKVNSILNGEVCKQPVLNEIKDIKGKRLKKGTVIGKPFYLNQSHGKRF